MLFKMLKGFYLGLILGGKHDRTIGIGLGVGQRQTTEDLGIGVEDTPLPLILLAVEDGIGQGLATTDLEGHGRWDAQMLDTTGACPVIVLKRTLVLTSEAYGPDEILLVGLLLLGSLPHLTFLLGGVVIGVGNDDSLGFGRRQSKGECWINS